MLFNKCPRCHEGEVFESKNPYDLARIFKVHKTCRHCDLKFEKEPSFFYGAMYVSYALTSGWFIVWYLLYANDVFKMETLTFGLLMAGSILALSPLTIRWSRLIWRNFFYKYDKRLAVKKHQAASQPSSIKITQ
jgi:uncharacterized protein (DUF983 family)